MIRIDRNESTKGKLMEYLKDVANEIFKGSLSGEDWEITGKEECEEDEPRDDDDDDRDAF